MNLPCRIWTHNLIVFPHSLPFVSPSVQSLANWSGKITRSTKTCWLDVKCSCQCILKSVHKDHLFSFMWFSFIAVSFQWTFNGASLMWSAVLDTQGSLGRCGTWLLPSRDLQSVNIREGTGQSLKDHLKTDVPPDKTASCPLQSVFGETDFRRVLFLPWTMNEDSWSFQKWDSLTWKLKKKNILHSDFDCLISRADFSYVLLEHFVFTPFCILTQLPMATKLKVYGHQTYFPHLKMAKAFYSRMATPDTESFYAVSLRINVRGQLRN